MEKEIKSDLFEELNQTRSKKRTRYPFRKLFPYDYVNIRLGFENIIFSLIVLLLFCVILFSLGIERGRRLKEARLELNDRSVETNQVLESSKNAPKSAVAPEKKTEQPPSAYLKADVSRTSAEQNKLREGPLSYNYTIQIVTYKDKSLTEKQMQQLIKRGYKPFIIYSKGFYQICVGKYSSRENAKVDLIALSRTYKDCFIRNIP